MSYKILRNVIPKVKVDAALEHLRNNSKEQLGIIEEIKQNQALEKFEDINFSKLTAEQKKLITGHFPAEVRLDKCILELVADPNLLEAVREYSSWKNMNIHLPPMARFVIPGNTNAKVPIHQDLAYNQHLDDFVTVWVPLVPVNNECGGVKCSVDPGFLVDMPTITENQIWLEGMQSQNLHFEECVPMYPGDILLFSKTTMHGSMDNNSNYLRYSLDLRYFPENVSSEKHYLSLETGAIYEPS